MTTRYTIASAISIKLYLAIALVATTAYHLPTLTNTGSDFVFHKNISTWRSVTSSSSSSIARNPTFLSSSSSWLKDALTGLGLNFSTEQKAFQNRFNPSKNKSPKRSTTGVVIRTASKPFNAKASTPASRTYTTRKESRGGGIKLTPTGVEGDYNHYRTVALDRTADRAVSILTTDSIAGLKEGGYPAVQMGDLGENLYVDGVEFAFFEVGKRYRFASMAAEDTGGVVVEITEKVEPCGNLCKLPYINDMQMQPKERLEKCKDFLFWLSQRDGLRGWYGRIIEGGTVKIGDKVSVLYPSTSTVLS